MPAIKQTQIFDWNSVKDALFFSVSTDNEEYRKEAPHRTVGEFTLNYNVLIEDGKGHSKASKIGMQALKVLNITEEDLYNATIESAPKLFPVSDNVFGGVARISTEQYTDKRLDDGATAIFYPDVLDHYAEMMGGKIYVLPTTKNDVIVIQDDGKYRTYEEVVKAVKDWDIYRVHGEKLTDNIYHYDAETKKFILGEEYVYSEEIERLQKAVQMYEYVELTEEEKNEYLPSDITFREIDEDGYIPLMYTVDETRLGRELQISYNVPEQQLHYFVCRSLVKAERWSIDEMIAYLEDEPDKTWEDLYDKAIDAEIRTGINVDEDSINDTAECQKEDEAILKKAEQAALQERKLLLGGNVVQSSEKNEQSDKSANQTADFYFLSDVRKRYEWELADDVMKGCTDSVDTQNFENETVIEVFDDLMKAEEFLNNSVTRMDLFTWNFSDGSEQKLLDVYERKIIKRTYNLDSLSKDLGEDVSKRKFCEMIGNNVSGNSASRGMDKVLANMEEYHTGNDLPLFYSDCEVYVVGMKEDAALYVKKFDNLNDAADHYIQLRDNAEGDLDFKVKLIGSNTGAEEIRNLEISDRETEDIRITFNQVVKDFKLGQKR
mgnify:FL=1